MRFRMRNFSVWSTRTVCGMSYL